jgi:hypothetical protein
VVLGGFLTNCCVESTMRSAYERGYKVGHSVVLVAHVQLVRGMLRTIGIGLEPTRPLAGMLTWQTGSTSTS